MLSRTVENMVRIDRLPTDNSLEAQLSLQDAWDHVDAYHQYATLYKTMTKASYALLLLAGIATCIIAILGRGIFAVVQHRICVIDMPRF
jgi:hypothetical protein